MSGLFRLNVNDLTKGVIVAILAAVLTYLQSPTTDISSIDWGYLLNVTVTAVGAYLVKNLLSDEDGKVLGKI